MSTVGNPRHPEHAQIGLLLTICAVLWAGEAVAVRTVQIPAALCGAASSNTVLASGFEAEYVARPSLGSGGAIDEVTRDIDVPGFGLRRFFLQVPSDLDPNVPVPLIVLLHGQAGSAAESVAAFTRFDWALVSASSRVIVIAPVAPTAQGSWNIPQSFELIQAGIDDTLARYNIDRNRVHGWGFSAGANMLHAMALSRPDGFASYAVHAGSLRRGAGNGAPSLASRPLPVQLWVGSNDTVYLPETQDDRLLFLNAGWTEGDNLRMTIHPGGHNYDTDQFFVVWQQACRFAVVP